MSYTKKVIIRWSKDNWLNFGPDDRNGDQVAAIAEFDEKTTAMISEGKMSEDVPVTDDAVSIIDIRQFTDQDSAEEWVSFNKTFATTHGFTMRNSVIISI